MICNLVFRPKTVFPRIYPIAHSCILQLVQLNKRVIEIISFLFPFMSVEHMLHVTTSCNSEFHIGTLLNSNRLLQYLLLCSPPYALSIWIPIMFLRRAIIIDCGTDWRIQQETRKQLFEKNVQEFESSSNFYSCIVFSSSSPVDYYPEDHNHIDVICRRWGDANLSSSWILQISPAYPPPPFQLRKNIIIWMRQIIPQLSIVRLFNLIFADALRYLFSFAHHFISPTLAHLLCLPPPHRWWY